jgi:hypothetical protein
MALGRITSFLSSLSPASDAAAPADEVPEDLHRRAQALSDQSGLANDGRRNPSSDIAAQLQTMVGAVRVLNENALQQGAALAVSQAGGELKNAVSGLGHLLSAVNAQALANGAAAPVREAATVIDGVEAGLAGTQAAAEQLIRHLPATQSQRAREVSDTFQAEMRAAIRQVRDALGSLNVRN